MVYVNYFSKHLQAKKVAKSGSFVPNYKWRLLINEMTGEFLWTIKKLAEVHITYLTTDGGSAETSKKLLMYYRDPLELIK